MDLEDVNVMYSHDDVTFIVVSKINQFFVLVLLSVIFLMKQKKKNCSSVPIISGGGGYLPWKFHYIFKLRERVCYCIRDPPNQKK